MSDQPKPFSPVSVAVIQFDPQCGPENVPANIERARLLATQAVERGARLIVLPELCCTGYSFSSRAEAFAMAESVPEGPTSRFWEAFAREAGIHLAVGIAEYDGSRLYNTAVLFGPGGYIGRYRKTHLWCRESSTSVQEISATRFSRPALAASA